MKFIQTILKSPLCCPVTFSDHAVYFDIETTGLSRGHSQVYLIGCFHRCGDSLQLMQWISEKPEEEARLLREFHEYLLDCHADQLISYNGDSFDLPFLRDRCRNYDDCLNFSEFISVDLYKIIKPLKSLLKLPNLKQPSLEHFLSLPAREYPDGAAGIRLYRSYVQEKKIPDKDLFASALLGHNQEDLYGLSQIPSILSYLDLLEGNYRIDEMQENGQYLFFQIQTDHPLPALFSNGNNHFYLTGQGLQTRIQIQIDTRGYRYYYPDYKNYEYIPSEDMAMHKSLTGFLDRTLRKKATPQTCYTWFHPNKDFISSKKRQEQYLKAALPRLIDTLQ